MNGQPFHKGEPSQEDSELNEWIESVEALIEEHGPDGAAGLLQDLLGYCERRGLKFPYRSNTPYINTIPKAKQPPYPGNREIERRIKSLIRWNAMAMVVRANRKSAGIGGHISTYASAATLFEVAFNHFLRGKDNGTTGDQVYFQGHAAPGIYARAFLEGRLSEEQLENFRRELAPGGGLSSYPHPWLMPGFWEFPTVSMGLGPIMAIYQARFNRYLQDRGLLDTSQSRVWAFMGDGETDEPESLGALTLASREKLDNLTFIINCNLQRLDGPVRGNGKIIQELEAAFRGAGWNVIKVIWGGDWDELLAGDSSGLLIKRMEEAVDGDYQKYSVEPGSYTRDHFFGKYPELLRLVENLSDEQIQRLQRGGHDPIKVYAALKAAVEHRGSPTVILAKTIKGYGLGEAGEGRNVTHQQKKLNEDELREFRSRFGIPISDQKIAETPFYRPPEESKEIQYLTERRKALGGFLPQRRQRKPQITAPKLEEFQDMLEGSGDRDVATTMSFVRLLGKLLKHPQIGKFIVPIIPDEARTFGMEALFRSHGIYSHAGQKYDPVDSDTFLYYREAKEGQILEEGITEAGSIASFIAAGTAYSTHAIDTIPFFTYYSMFGFQRIGDLIWAAADTRCKGFLLGGTAGRTTLAGEGLQHQDGHSHVLASTVPTVAAYDPAFEYEIAAIIVDGIRRMYEAGEDLFYYITIGNEKIVMPKMPEGAVGGILKGMYLFRAGEKKQGKPFAQLFGSGAIMMEVLRAQDILREKYGVESNAWSVTSYKELRREAIETDRWNRLHPGDAPKKPYVQSLLEGQSGPIIAATDYMKCVPEMIAKWTPGGLTALGTDGFGRSENRASLRRFFEVDAECVALAALHELAQRGEIEMKLVRGAVKELGIDPEKINPVVA
ncbi:pyruvate dehydrogenase (acetyl-transferring), homodimeric type [Candidatus Sumerlaeota bacterium]|nr:pyruvate dehydrogenase (acetyl-transferring), homodimeric type [Candidatus Sumerlaeota bacterium]